jgi:hypothetical protein
MTREEIEAIALKVIEMDFFRLSDGRWVRDTGWWMHDDSKAAHDALLGHLSEEENEAVETLVRAIIEADHEKVWH